MRAGSFAAGVLMLLAGCPTACERQGATTSKTDSGASSKPAPLFVDATARAGLDFASDCGPQRTYFMPESIGAGG